MTGTQPPSVPPHIHRNIQMFIHGYAACEAVVRRCFSQLLSSHTPAQQTQTQSKENVQPRIDQMPLSHIFSTVLFQLTRERHASLSAVLSPPQCMTGKMIVDAVASSVSIDSLLYGCNYLYKLSDTVETPRSSSVETMKAPNHVAESRPSPGGHTLQRCFAAVNRETGLTQLRNCSNAVWRPWS